MNIIDFLSILFGIIGVIGTGFTIISFIRNPKKQLVCLVKTTSLISEKTSQISRLKIKYEPPSIIEENDNIKEKEKSTLYPVSYPIENLYFSTIQIINEGNCTVNKDDISVNQPFSVHTKGFFLDVTEQNSQFLKDNPKNPPNIELKKNENNLFSIAILNFENIPRNQIITFSLFHTDKITFDDWTFKNGKTVSILDENILTASKPYSLRKKITTRLIYIICSILLILYFFLTRVKTTEVRYIDVNPSHIEQNSELMQNYINNVASKINDLIIQLQQFENIISIDFDDESKTQE